MTSHVPDMHMPMCCTCKCASFDALHTPVPTQAPSPPCWTTAAPQAPTPRTARSAAWSASHATCACWPKMAGCRPCCSSSCWRTTSRRARASSRQAALLASVARTLTHFRLCTCGHWHARLCRWPRPGYARAASGRVTCMFNCCACRARTHACVCVRTCLH